MLSYIDIHVHIDPADRKQGIRSLRNLIVSRETADNGPCSAGVHPWYILDEGKDQLQMLADMLAETPEVLAVGECGLDKACGTDWVLQNRIFTAQLRLAEAQKKPVIVHCVRAYSEVIQALNSTKVTQPIIFHGYRKGRQLAGQLLQSSQQIYLSFGAAILAGKQDEVLRQVPMHRIFLETDHDSVSIQDIYMYFCRVRHMALPALQEQVQANYDRVFQKQ